MYVCPTCGRRVRPASEPEIVFAVKKVTDGAKVATTRTALDYGEWIGGFFHGRCFPSGSSEWRRRPMPLGIDDGDGES
jgi:hypothetical protein